jgi:hypothetical protein
MGMRNLKPSEAAMRRERSDFDLPSEPVSPRCLVARIEDISGFEPEPRGRRPYRPATRRRSGSLIAMIAVALVFAAFCVAVFVPGALGL